MFRGISPLNKAALVIAFVTRGILAAELGLVAHCTFDEGSGAVARDASGNEIDGKIVGAEYVKSPRGYALRFDGKDDYVAFEKTDALAVKGDLTVEAWIRTDYTDRPATHRLIVGDAAGMTIFRNHNLRIDHRQRLRFEWGDGLHYAEMTADAAILDGTWKHVAVVVESRTAAYLYIDGRQIERLEAQTPVLPTRSGPFRIGGWGHGHFIGDIDEVRIYNRAIAEREIIAHAGRDPSALRPTIEIKAGINYTHDRLHVGITGRHIETDSLTADLTLADAGGQRVLVRKPNVTLTESRPGRERWAAEAEHAANDIEPGDYVVRVVLKEAGGNVVAESKAALRRIERPKWFRSRAGYSHEVLPPYTPIKISGGPEGATVSTWGREHVFGPSPFPTRITSQGTNVLAQPIRLMARAESTPLAWRGARPVIAERSPAKIVLKQESEGDRVDLSVKSGIEFDGFIRIDWALTPRRDLTIDRLAVEIPLTAHHAKYLYDIPNRHHGLLRRDYVSRFRPVIWLGNDDVGLTWAADSDQNWHLADESKAIEVTRGPREVVLRLNLIDQPTRLGEGERLAYTYVLQATPVRPVLRDAWEQRLVRARPYAHEFRWPTMKIDGKPLLEYYADAGVRAMLVWRMWDAFSYPWPWGKEDEFRKLVEACHAYGLKVVPYGVGFLYSAEAPEYQAFRDEMIKMPPAPWYVNRLPGLKNQMTYRACPAGPWQDLCVDGVRRLIEEFDADGIYLDGTVCFPLPCTNRSNGCGYVRPDGTIGGTHHIFDSRRLLKRLYTVVKTRKPNGFVDAHTSNRMFSPALAFATASWNGEQLPPATVTDQVPLDRFRCEFMTRNWGVPADFLYYRTRDYNAATALCLVHDVPVRPENKADLDILAPLWKLRDRFGVREAQWRPYWRSAEYVTVQPERCHASLYQHPRNGVLIAVSNLGKTDTTVRLTVRPNSLGLSDGAAARDALTDEPIHRDGWRLSIPVKSQDWRMLWITGVE